MFIEQWKDDKVLVEHLAEYEPAEGGSKGPIIFGRFGEVIGRLLDRRERLGLDYTCTSTTDDGHDVASVHGDQSRAYERRQICLWRGEENGMLSVK